MPIAARSLIARLALAPARRLLCLGASLLFVFGPEPALAEPSYDLVLRGGTLYAGGHEMAGEGDVAIRDDRIVAVGEAAGSAQREIDATGLVVAPGFIDLHNHTDEMPTVILIGMESKED